MIDRDSALAAFVCTLVVSGTLGGCRSQETSNLLGQQRPAVFTFASHGDRMTDGVVTAPGAAWSSSLAARFDQGGSAEWDLGRSERISRIWIHADNDDRYVILASRDRHTWSTLWEAPPVAGRGLSARSVERLEGEARFLRLEPRGGDGRYAVAELVVNGRPSDPWPPRLEQRGGASEVWGRPPLGALILLAAVLGLLALAGPWRRLERSSASGAWWRQPLFFLTFGLAVFVALTALRYATVYRHNLADDAYISLQYAKNWVSGQGLTFNPGERVEGYTNFLWVALLAPLWPLAGGDPALMTRASVWLAIGLAVAGLGLMALIGRRLFRRELVPTTFALLLVAFDDAYLSYAAMFALENHLLIVCMLVGLALAEYRPRGWEYAIGASFALVGMTRPDGLLWGATFLATYALPLLRRPATGPPGPDLRSLLKAGTTFALLFGGYFLLRFLYFGDLLPNTFHLKVGGTFAGLPRGFQYLWTYVLQRAGLPVVALAAVVFVRTSWARWLLLHIALHSLYVAYVGGDFYAGHRFLLALTPSLALLAAGLLHHALQATSTSWRRRAMVFGALVLCVGVRWGTLRGGPYSSELHGFAPVVDNNVKYMQWLKQVARPQASLIVGDIGAAGLFADVRVIDVFGVVDRAVARKHVPDFGTGKAGHEKMLTPEQQLERNPTYIKWGYVDDHQPPPGYYIFNDFPRHLRVEGLWVLDDLARGRTLEGFSFHMDPGQMVLWQRSGEAFAHAPSLRAAHKQAYVNGHRGHLINSFSDSAGDDATGRLLSPEFQLVGDRMRLLVGGGRDPERLRVSLLMGNRRVYSETGSNWETLGRREWDIAPLRGQVARIEIVDDAAGAWGHILVDEIEQWAGQPNTSGKL